MKLYIRLAAGGIRRNSKLYVPYILTCSLMVMMFYIVGFLATNSMLEQMRGGDSMAILLRLGVYIMAIFSAIFLFYTNSFLIKRRKKEFGLYSILGMGKRSIARVMTWETLMVYLLSVTLGLLAGILFSKLAELLAIKILRGTAHYEFTVSGSTIVLTAAVFAGIFLLIYLNVLRQVFFSKAIDLLHSENAGEKPPRANWFLAVLGAVTLGIAYYMAVAIEQPITAALTFFAAVIMVVAATYLLFIAGSVALCRVLQRNKRYYYTTRHFISVSQMAYRMKRGGAGLASICILCTMLLVTLSSTICLYMGEEHTIGLRYPRDILISTSGMSEQQIQKMQSNIDDILNEHGKTADNILKYHYVSMYGILDGSTFTPYSDVNNDPGALISDVRTVYVIPAKDAESICGTEITVKSGEAALYLKGGGYNYDKINIKGSSELKITQHIDKFTVNSQDAATVYDSIYLFVKDISVLEDMSGANSFSPDNICYYYAFDIDGTYTEKYNAYQDITESISEVSDGASYNMELASIEDFLGSYGGLFFLGIVFGSVFLLAAVLIMYYKQVSEGYDDSARFDILRKVGMNDREIRRAVNSQVLTVFFAPLIAAGIHMAFAFPMLSKLLALFAMTDTAFLAGVTLACFGAFAAVYILVYAITSRSYYRIVSRNERR